MAYAYLLLLLGGVIALCIFINRITDKLKVPALLLFIGLGMVFGQDREFYSLFAGQRRLFGVPGLHYFLRRIRHQF